MKKLIVALCFTSLLAVAAHAEDKPAAKTEAKKTPLTAEQKEARKALKDKYDTNKDGNLDKEERAKISKEELEKAGYSVKEKKAAK